MRILPILLVLLIVVISNYHAKALSEREIQMYQLKLRSIVPKIGILSDISINDRKTGPNIQQDLYDYFVNNGTIVFTIHYDDNINDIKQSLPYLDGFVFPPNCKMCSALASDVQERAKALIYLDTARVIYNYAKQTTTPLLGIDDGLLMIYTIESGKQLKKMLFNFKSEYKKLESVPEYVTNKQYIRQGQTVYFATDRGLPLESFVEVPIMTQKFTITSVSQRGQLDGSNIWTVSSFEGQALPIMAVQFEPQRPENNQEVFKNRANQYLKSFEFNMVKFFIQSTRQKKNVKSNPESVTQR